MEMKLGNKTVLSPLYECGHTREVREPTFRSWFFGSTVDSQVVRLEQVFSSTELSCLTPRYNTSNNQCD